MADDKTTKMPEQPVTDTGPGKETPPEPEKTPTSPETEKKTEQQAKSPQVSVYDFAEIMKGKKAEERAAASGGEKPAPAKTEKPEKQPEVPKKAEGKQEKPKEPEQPKRRGRPPKEDKDKAAAPKPKAPSQKKQEKAPKEKPEKKAAPTVQAAPAPKEPEGPKEAPRRGEEQIVYIKLNELHAFKNHPFEVRDDEEMRAMVSSVKDKGVTQPAMGNVFLWTSKQPLSEHDLARLQELAVSSRDIANELGNYMVRQEHGVNVYGLDDFPAEYVQVLDGELNMEKWRAGTGVYVTPLRMMGDGSLCLYQPGDKISVQQLDGTNKIYDVLAVVDIPKALETPLQVDMGLDYIFPTNELLGNMVSADQPAMKTIFNVDNEYQLATENWLKNYTTNTDTALDYLSKVTLRQTFDGMINMYRLVGGALCAILALIGILNFINSMMTSILSRYKELAMLQSVGMTGRQVKQMLMIEGIGYSALGLICSLLLSIVGSLTVVRMMGAELSYFTWHFTLLPVLLCVIPLVLITAFVPLVCYNKMAQKTVVERLRIAE